MSIADDPMPDLLRSLRSQLPDARAKAARALGRLGWLAKDALPPLAVAVQDSDARVREAAAHAVGLMGPDALPELVRMLSHADKYVRRNAVWALGKLGPLARPALGPLCRALKDADSRTASGAAQAIGHMGADAAEAVPALTEAMRGTNIVLCRLAAKALSQVGRPALADLLTHLRHKDPFVRGEAALALGWMGPAAAIAVPGLIDALRSPRPAGRRLQAPLAATAATPVTPVTPPPQPGPAADDASRANAAQALGRIGPGATAAGPALTAAATDDPCDQVRQAARLALRQIGSQ